MLLKYHNIGQSLIRSKDNGREWLRGPNRAPTRPPGEGCSARHHRSISPESPAIGELCLMKMNSRRIALLTGASVAVLGSAAPAYAATTTSPGINHSTTSADPVNDTITLCDIGDICHYTGEISQYGICQMVLATSIWAPSITAMWKLERIRRSPVRLWWMVFALQG